MQFCSEFNLTCNMHCSIEQQGAILLFELLLTKEEKKSCISLLFLKPENRKT